MVWAIGADHPLDSSDGGATWRQPVPVSPAFAAGIAVIGTAIDPGGMPLPHATIVLRRLDDGREGGRVESGPVGTFAVSSAAGGLFVIELRTARGRLLAVTDPFAVADGEARAVEVRTRGGVPWSASFFKNSATAAIEAASTHGITALGSSGWPASPQ